MVELDLLQKTKLFLICRVYQQRPNTTSLKCITQPSLIKTTNVLYGEGYLSECGSPDPGYLWVVSPTFKGEETAECISPTTLIRKWLQSRRSDKYCYISDLIINSTIPELSEMVVDRDPIVSVWARAQLCRLIQGSEERRALRVYV